ncbi:hypothetical protein [Aurantiacibacter sp. D1-12]|uniref:hypothetical protein n=1 Tax=Aurantiacibacter sp. D1-12 TaxID=2993658 RepID=UPI00237CFD86|nr:hypothetical protein [Aurantiacibacter sp. D1-12]MDE1468325.1 hypothetical protein [Aurantiacibacter sp. D1-12]
MIEETFHVLRSCGDNRRECQLYWVSSWNDPLKLLEVVHPRHLSSAYALSIDSGWINEFWNDLADRGMGVRVQVHTHPSEAFHSATDDAYPLLPEAGFLSLVIPDFAMGPVGFDRAYLTEIQSDGSWQQVDIEARIQIDG